MDDYVQSFEMAEAPTASVDAVRRRASFELEKYSSDWHSAIAYGAGRKMIKEKVEAGGGSSNRRQTGLQFE